MGFATFVYNQFFVHPSLPNASFTNQTVIITGSNSGLGRETARHIARLGAQRVILAVRDTSAGESARLDIELSTGCPPGTCEVWPLDLADSTSVLAFADKALALPRLDSLVLNAAVATKIFRLAPGGSYEHSITVNSISHFLLAILLLPKLRQTARRNFPAAEERTERRAVAPHITVLTSQVHAWPQFPQWKDPRGIFASLSDEATAKMDERYPVTKLLNVLLTRELVAQMGSAGDGVIVNMLDTGFCHSRLSRENAGIEALVFDLAKRIFARSEEVGARTTVTAMTGGRETHGQYMVNGVVASDALSEFVRGEDGKTAQRRLWDELSVIAEGLRPGVMAGVTSS